MTSLDAAPALAPAGTRSLRPAAYLLYALLVVSQLAIAVFSWWEPVFDGEIRYDDVAPLAGGYWPMNVLLGGPGYALGTIASTIFLVVLGAGRGNVLTLVGATVHLVAGVVFALVITAEVLPFAWAADPAMFGEAEGRALFETYNDGFGAFLPYILGSMAAVALGALLAVTGAAISGGLPWWVLAAAVGVAVAVFALPLGSPLAPVASLAQHALWLFIGWCGLRAMVTRA